MTFQIVTDRERPDLLDRWREVRDGVWPVFIDRDPVCNRYWSGLNEQFPDCQTYLIDDRTDELVGRGSSVPVAWDGTSKGLPGGVDDVLIAAFGGRTPQQPATALCALQAAIMPDHQGRGLSRVIIAAMRDRAMRLGLPDLIGPVRPNRKSLYPLTPIARYVEWRRADGLPLDPWLRVHEKLGATIMGIAERSMTVPGTVAEWQDWTGLAFPETGQYVVAGALVPISIDVENDRGLYVEPNVWMRHRIV